MVTGGVTLGATHPSGGTLTHGSWVAIFIRKGGGVKTQKPSQPMTIDGRYAVDSVLGRDPQVVTLLARQLGMQRRVVLRLLKDADHLPAFKSEVLTVASIVHPNVVKVFDSDFQPDGRAFAVFDFIEGKRLDDPAIQPPLAASRVVGILRQICAALVAAHDSGAAHGRLARKYVYLQPSNANSQERVTVTGFGVAPDSSEQALAQARCSDVRAIGQLACELLGASLDQPRSDATMIAMPELRDIVACLTRTDTVPPTASETLTLWNELARSSSCG